MSDTDLRMLFQKELGDVISVKKIRISDGS
jgi:hypothetical protein